MRPKDLSGGDEPARCWQALSLCIFMFMFCSQAIAQEKALVQVRTLDQELNPVRNIDISINGKEFIAMGSKGVAFTELAAADLPPKSITVKNEQLEAASWNYTKGIVEVIIRKKSYQLVPVIVRNKNHIPLANVRLTFKGKKATTLVTSRTGRVEIPLALDEKIASAEQFDIPEYRIIELLTEGQTKTLTVVSIAEDITAETPVTSKPGELKSSAGSAEYFRNFDLAMLDSIQSLTVFYAVFKNYEMKNLSQDAKEKLDNKFTELVADLQDSLRKNETAFIGKISDSSFVSDDLQNLIAQATLENETLAAQRGDFDQKLRIISDKLAAGIENLDAGTRARLLSDLNRLEALLVANESRFYRNQSDYRDLINSLREKFFDFEDLENRLSASEAQRLEEQRVFRQRLLITVSLVLLFGVLLVRLIYFSNKLRQQKKQLEQANEEIASMNENLEDLVHQRTRSLEEAHRELDTFLYRASHDLRSPVCSIIGLCNLASYFSTGEAKELMNKVADATTGMDRLLKKLSLISEINQPVNFGPLSLSDTIEKVRDEFSHVISSHRISFVVNCSPDLVINTYQNIVEAILTNLLENAFFFSAMKNTGAPLVELTAATANNQLEIRVYDNGIGIDQKISDKLFAMFFKGNVYSKGNGLGLYIVQKAVEALDGEVSVESDAGHYTQFVVVLPLRPADTSGSKDPEAAEILMQH